MGPQRIIGIALLIIGAAILAFGLHSSGSFADQAHQTFFGRYTNGTMWYILGGGALAVIGLLAALIGPRGRSA